MSGQNTGFKAKVLNSAKLSSLKFVSDVGLRVVSTVVLSRLLAPDIYGVFAIVLVYLYMLEMFSDIGIRSLILTKEGDVDDDFIRTCWTVSILRGLTIAVVSALIAIIIALLQARDVFSADNPYSAAALPWAIAALGGSSLILSFGSPMRFLSEREMAFGRVTLVDITRNAVALVVTIGLAFYLRSIWALVLGNLARALVHLVLSYAVFRGPPMRLRLHRDHLRLLIDRGKWVLSHSAMTALSQSADRLVLGFVMTSSSFGFYFIARQLVDIITQFMSSISGQMVLQMFTHLQKSGAEKFRRNYYRYRLFFDALGGISVGGLIVLAPLLVEIVFDDRYRPVAPIIQVIALAILLYGPLQLRDALTAARRFKDVTLLGVVSTTTLCLGLFIAIFGFDSTTGALVAIALHRLPEALIVTWMGWKQDWVVFQREFLPYVFCGIGALAGWGILLLWKALI